MAIQTTYTQARARFAELLDRAADDKETVIIRRRGKPDVAVIDAAELRSLRETAHLFGSPANAQALLAALERAEGGGAVSVAPEQLDAIAAALRRGDREGARRLVEGIAPPGDRPEVPGAAG